MRPRVATHPVRLEPAKTAELLSLARLHDEKLKDLRQDLFRAETKLYRYRLWRWPIHVAVFASGSLAVLAWQNERIRENVIAFFVSALRNVRQGGVQTLVILLAACLVLGVVMLIAHRLIRGPSPEARARKLMQQFANANGVASYVFTDEDTAEGEASLVNALIRPGAKKKKIRQRRLTQDNRPLVSAMTHLLNQNLIQTAWEGSMPEAETANADPETAVRPAGRGETG